MNEQNYEIIDNFLSEEDFERISQVMQGPDIPWYFNDKIVSDPKRNSLNDYQLTHKFYFDYSISSRFFDILIPIIEKIKPIAIIRIKANLNPRTENTYEHGYHTDTDYFPENQKTAVFYINNNNGLTIFEDGTTVESVANRLLVFKTGLLHTGTTCTDQKKRIVINFNYIV